MIAMRSAVLTLALLTLGACTGTDDAKQVDSADGELEVPHRRSPPYRAVEVTESGTITGTVAAGAAGGDSTAPAGGPARTAPAAPEACAGKSSTQGAAVYLEDIAQGRGQAQDVPRRYELAVDDCAITPSVIVAAAGATLNVTNSVNAVHHVAFTYEGMKSPLLDVPFAATGQVVPSEKVLAVPGVVDVRSDRGPGVQARLVVVEHPYAADASAGTFTIDSVPPGTYMLIAVGPAGRARSRVVIRAGATTPVTLRLQ